jgi:hypothetical protein
MDWYMTMKVLAIRQPSQLLLTVILSQPGQR